MAEVRENYRKTRAANITLTLNVSTAMCAATLRRKTSHGLMKTVTLLFINNPKHPKKLSFAKKLCWRVRLWRLAMTEVSL